MAETEGSALEFVPVIDLSGSEIKRVAHIGFRDGSQVVGTIVAIHHDQYGKTAVTLKVGHHQIEFSMDMTSALHLEPAE